MGSQSGIQGLMILIVELISPILLNAACSHSVDFSSSPQLTGSIVIFAVLIHLKIKAARRGRACRLISPKKTNASLVECRMI